MLIVVVVLFVSVQILVDRVLTATVFNLMIHAAIFYGLRVIVDLYHILFLWDVPELGFLKFFKHPFHFLFTSVFSLGWLLLCAAVGVVTWMNYRRLQCKFLYSVFLCCALILLLETSVMVMQCF